MDRKEFINAKRIVIKLGTNVLRNKEGEASLPRLYSYIEDISRLVKHGKEVILVTSGAVGLGRKKLNVEKSDDIVLKQACAAIGQSKLMSIYESGFDTYGIKVAQILLVEDDFAQRRRYLSLRNTLNKLLELGVVPIINQNDTVSTLELETLYKDAQVSFSDNDKLSALVASELDAELLLILSDIDGLYDCNPKTNTCAKIIKQVDDVTDEIMNMASGVSDGGRGGMKTKLEAARMVTRSGCKMLIANGKITHIIEEIFNGTDEGTMFMPANESLSGKKRWIGYATNIIGKIVVNNGAKKAVLEKGSSILPIGVTDVINEFKRGEVISILDEDKNEIARGIANYNSDECKKIMGQHSDNIFDILGYKNYDEIVVRDNITTL
ncbi:glutamate 5-kinase [bacterium]|nr:glutamate 5-kinase [bacterium]